MKINKVELEKIKNDLLKRKRELEQNLQDLSSQQMVDQQSKDDADLVVSNLMENLRNSLQDTEYQEYTNIVLALDAIDKGTYGICQECGQAISENRLKYNPNARRCISCQQRVESGF